jgi:hypothetical protein
VDVEVNDARPPHVIVAERLQRLAAGAAGIAAQLERTTDIIDAEIVEDTGQPLKKTAGKNKITDGGVPAAELPEKNNNNGEAQE